MGRHSLEVLGSGSTNYKGYSWAVHAALKAVTPEDIKVLGPRCDEVVMASLAISGRLSQPFTVKELTRASYDADSFAPLSENHANRILDIGMRACLLKNGDVQNHYSLSSEPLREHMVALSDWMPHLLTLVLSLSSNVKIFTSHPQPTLYSGQDGQDISTRHAQPSSSPFPASKQTTLGTRHFGTSRAQPRIRWP